VHSSHETLGIYFDSLLFNLQRAHDVLDTLDTYLVETCTEKTRTGRRSRTVG